MLIHQEVPAEAPPDEADVLVQAAAVTATLEASGHQVFRLTANLDLATLQRKIALLAPDCIFNLVESLDGAASLLHLAPALWQRQGISYTGCSVAALLLTTDKLLTKERLAAAGLPTPPWVVRETAAAPEGQAAVIVQSHGRDNTASSGRSHSQAASWIVKSITEHASSGINDTSIWHDLRPSAVMARLPQGSFAEEFIAGREFNVTLLGDRTAPRILPPAEILFLDFPPDKPQIVGYAAKWLEHSFEATHTVRRFITDGADAPLLAELQRLALACWQLFGLSGVARVDFRVTPDGAPFILEVNANPCLAPDGGFAAAVTAAGLSYQEAIEIIVAAAMQESEGLTPGASQPAAKPEREPLKLRWRYEVSEADSTTLAAGARETGFFNEGEVAIVAELVRERLTRGHDSGYQFVVAECDGAVVGYTIFGAIPCTCSSFDLYWLVVRPPYQGQGIGRELLAETERTIMSQGGTRLYAETSGRAQYAPTRAFYERMGFNLGELLEDFYAPGDARATYVKALSAYTW